MTEYKIEDIEYNKGDKSYNTRDEKYFLTSDVKWNQDLQKYEDTGYYYWRHSDGCRFGTWAYDYCFPSPKDLQSSVDKLNKLIKELSEWKSTL